MENGFWGILFIAALFLLWQKWFWQIAFFIAALASFFAVLASIVHFQILGALGFSLLFVITGAIYNALMDGE